MNHRLLRRKEKASRREKFLSEIDRLVCWKKLASCAEVCLNEAPDTTNIRRTSLEALVRIAVLQRCFDISLADIVGLQRSESVAAQPDSSGGQDDLPDNHEVERFIQLIACCRLRGRIMGELETQLAKVGVSLKRPLIVASS